MAGSEGDRGAECLHSPHHFDQVPVLVCGEHGSGARLWSGNLLADEDFQVKLYSSGIRLCCSVTKEYAINMIFTARGALSNKLTHVRTISIQGMIKLQDDLFNHIA